MERADHLKWCKTRALEYVDRGDLTNAFMSMLSDLQNHQETANHIGIQLGVVQQMGGLLDTDRAMRDFILGFN